MSIPPSESLSARLCSVVMSVGAFSPFFGLSCVPCLLRSGCTTLSWTLDWPSVSGGGALRERDCFMSLWCDTLDHEERIVSLSHNPEVVPQGMLCEWCSWVLFRLCSRGRRFGPCSMFLPTPQAGTPESPMNAEAHLTKDQRGSLCSTKASSHGESPLEPSPRSDSICRSPSPVPHGHENFMASTPPRIPCCPRRLLEVCGWAETTFWTLERHCQWSLDTRTLCLDGLKPCRLHARFGNMVKPNSFRADKTVLCNHVERLFLFDLFL